MMTEIVAGYDHYFPATLTLETPRVLLRLLQPGDEDHFLPLTKNPDTWKYFVKDLSDETSFRQWMADAYQDRAQQRRMPFTIIDKSNNVICGSISYGNISSYDKRLEIGWTWLGPQFMGTGVNRHAKFALLTHAFEVMKMERVEIKTDNLNERSKAALFKIGMTPEGIFRNHMQMHSNRRRDSIYFSMIRNEWAEKKQAYFADLA